MIDSATLSDYASPRQIEGVDDCYFYHTIDLPELGEVPGDWDLRECAGAYLGNYDFQGKRALDVGTASGFLSFEMEKRGAEVVSFDMVNGRNWDAVPYASQAAGREKRLDKQEQSDKRLKNSYWLAHRLLGSKAKACYGNIYEPLPESVGEFDVAVFGMIFTHLRDPFGALCSILPRVTETVILTNTFLDSDDALARFAPSIENRQRHAFWIPSQACVNQMFEILGFTLERTVSCVAECSVPGFDSTGCTSMVARRQ